MNVIACIPFWLDYDKNDNNQMKKLAGKYLINYTINTLEKVKNIDESVVFCSKPEVLNYIEASKKINFLKRDEYLDNHDISIEDIIGAFLQYKDADIIVLVHPNCPFIKEETIEECINKVKDEGYDSSFTASKIEKFAWMNNERLNYEKDKPTPHKSLLEPIVVEQGSVYVFKKETFIEYNRRIGENPFIKYINHFEGHEVSEVEDFETAELIINSGMNLE